MVNREPASAKLSTIQWAEERLENSRRISARKTRDELIGWLEDVSYWEQIVADLKRTAGLEAALSRIAKWFGEFPETGCNWDDGTPMSYGACNGSNGERDYMREVAVAALSGDTTALDAAIAAAKREGAAEWLDMDAERLELEAGIADQYGQTMVSTARRNEAFVRRSSAAAIRAGEVGK